MKAINFDPNVLKQLSAIQKKDIKLYKQILKQINSLQQNPRLKSLRLHKVSLEFKNSWSISITKGFRMIYTETKEEYYFYKVGAHDEVYRKR